MIWKKAEEITTDSLNQNIINCINNDLLCLSRYIHIRLTNYEKAPNTKKYKYKSNDRIFSYDILSLIYQFAYNKFEICMIFDGRYDDKRNEFRCTVVAIHSYYKCIIFRSHIFKQRLNEEVNYDYGNNKIVVNDASSNLEGEFSN